jgi:peptide/nickel transport system substrate-binding protein
LTANENYFVDGQPNVDRLEYVFFSDRAAAVDALRTEQVDLVMQLPTPLYQGLAEAEGIERYQVATNAFPVIRLRADQPPGDDPRVMQAMKMSIDREAIFELVQQGMGELGRDTPVGPAYPALYTEDIPLEQRDVAGARQLLADAGYEDGLDLTLRLPEAQNFPDLAVVLKEQLAEAGFNIEVSVEPESVYYGENGWLEATFGITGWGHRPYPQFYLDVMLVCGAMWNEAHFCDEEFDQVAETAGSATDESEQVEAYHDLQRILIERGPIIIPFFFPQLGAQRDYVEGFQMKAFPGRSDFRPVSINQ